MIAAQPHRYVETYVWVIETLGGVYIKNGGRTLAEARAKADAIFRRGNPCRAYNNQTGELYVPKQDPATVASGQRLEFPENKL